MTVQKPYVTAVVAYKRVGLPNGKFQRDVVPAIVTGVDEKNPQLVDLVIFSSNGIHFTDKQVAYGKKMGQWSWPAAPEKMEV